MKIAILIFSLVVVARASASLDTMTIQAKVVAFDGKTVTLDIAGEKYRFEREKLGKPFRSVTKGETVDIEINPSKDLARK